MDQDHTQPHSLNLGLRVSENFFGFLPASLPGPRAKLSNTAKVPPSPKARASVLSPDKLGSRVGALYTPGVTHSSNENKNSNDSNDFTCLGLQYPDYDNPNVNPM